MLTLYAAATSNGLRTAILLEELGLEYDLRPVDLFKGEQHDPAFLALNPNAQIPVLVDDSGPGGETVVLDQSAAIMWYLAEKEEKLLPETPLDRARFLPIFMSIVTDASMTVSTIFAITRLPEIHEPTLAHFAGRIGLFLGVHEKRLVTSPYIAGDQLTIADLALVALTIRMREVTPELINGFPALDRWMDGLLARPAVQRGVAAVS